MEFGMVSLSVRSAREAPGARAVGIWLLAVALLIAAMVTVGGLTRLTGSGLSITEWHPVTGAIPPMSEQVWTQEFAKYQRIPQYRLEHPNMALADFKEIYWWEWSHRLLGRLLALSFFLPFLFFIFTKVIGWKDLPRLFGLFALGGLQGFVGWWMVESGLEERVSVSQYRLAIHLGVAIVLLGAILWTALDYWCEPDMRQRSAAERRLFPWALAFTALVFLQMLLGALVAGLHAGLVYNTWPSMNGRVFPEAPFFAYPWWVNFGENAGLVQFDHRIGAYVVALSALALWTMGRRFGSQGAARASGNTLLAVTGFQIVLGIVTLLNQAPVSLAALHQDGAVALLASAVWHTHEIRPRVATSERPWPTGLITGIAFAIGLLYCGFQGASQNSDWSNIHLQIGTITEALFGGLFTAIAARGICYFRNRDLQRRASKV
jgi:heme a synthase